MIIQPLINPPLQKLQFFILSFITGLASTTLLSLGHSPRGFTELH